MKWIDRSKALAQKTSAFFKSASDKSEPVVDKALMRAGASNNSVWIIIALVLFCIVFGAMVF